jgi:acetolactate synthase-1/2/3 large subunit
MGDGGLQMSIQEFGTIMEHDIPVKMILLNNNYLGNVRQWQDMFFGHRQSFTPMTNPDFRKIAEAYNIPYRCVADRAELNDAINEMLTTKGAFLLETVIKPNANVEPMTAPGKAVDEMILNVEC